MNPEGVSREESFQSTQEIASDMQKIVDIISDYQKDKLFARGNVEGNLDALLVRYLSHMFSYVRDLNKSDNGEVGIISNKIQNLLDTVATRQRGVLLPGISIDSIMKVHIIEMNKLLKELSNSN